MKLNGHVKGYVCGMVDGEFTGTLRGDLNASVISQTGPGLEEMQEGGKDHE